MPNSAINADIESEPPHLYSARRTGDEFMSMERLASAYPHALSFPRLAVALLVKGRWKLERLWLSLDAEGEGEALYRFSSGPHQLHYFVISNAYPESEKTDHNTGDKWDILSALCQGEWTPDREAVIRHELSKQRSGRPDYDTLVYARANRSGRLFDHVVESLAAGRQPDGHRLASVGYIARTTSFAGNGLLGMRQFSGYGADHPLNRPYHAQMCGAMLLREFVYDLVDHMASARGGAQAVPLDTGLKRYLGIGNSAASGLVYFVANHPRMMQRWGENLEQALDQVRARSVRKGDREIAAFKTLLDRACRYLAECRCDDNEVFADPEAVRGELAAFAIRIAPLVENDVATDLWSRIDSMARETLGIAAREILNSILLELYEDIQAHFIDRFWVDEELRTAPEMPLGMLRRIIDHTYGWMEGAEPDDHHYFWYRSEDAPGDPRRGIRGRTPGIEHETPLDLSLKVSDLKRAIAEREESGLTGDLLLERPDLHYVVSRIQTLRDAQYAEYRQNYLSRSFNRFIPVRLILSFYGMEKFNTHRPKAVRGAFLQGAPLAQDIARGKDGTWPFPVMPLPHVQPVEAAQPADKAREGQFEGDVARVAKLAENRARRYVDTRGANPVAIKVSPVELLRATQKTLQGLGMSLGPSTEAALLVLQGEMICGEAYQSLVAQIEAGEGLAEKGAPAAFDANGVLTLDAGSAPFITRAPTLADAVAGRALASAEGIAAAAVFDTHGFSALEYLAARTAERGLVSVLAWRGKAEAEPLGRNRIVISGPGEGSPWMIAIPGSRSSRIFSSFAPKTAAHPVTGGWFSPDLLLEQVPQETDMAGLSAVFICARPTEAHAGLFEQLAGQTAGGAKPAAIFAPGALSDAFARAEQEGLDIKRPHFDAIFQLSEGVRVPREKEKLVASE